MAIVKFKIIQIILKLICIFEIKGSGGTRIITSSALVVFDYSFRFNLSKKKFILFFIFFVKTAAQNLILKRDLLYSVDSPRIHQQLWPDEVLFEENFDRV